MIAMQRVRLVAAASILALLAVPARLPAQPGDASELIDPQRAREAGLRVRWFTVAQLDPATTRILQCRLAIRSKKSRIYYEIEADGEFEVIPITQRDPYGEPLGDERAKTFAEERAQRYRDRGYRKVEVRRKVVPQMIFFVLTDAALLQAFDAETGETLWKQSVGRPDLVSVGPAVSEDYVAVINGMKLHVFNIETGNRLWTEVIEHSAGVPPVLVDHLVFVPSISGEVFGYDIRDRFREVPAFRSFGRILVPVARADKHLIWADDKGYVNIAGAYRFNIEHMIETEARLETPPVFQPPNLLLFATHHGMLYAMDAAQPRVRWRYATGQRTYQRPVVIGDRVYFITDVDGMACLETEEGKRLWTAPMIVKFIAASRDHIYALDRARRVVKLDARTGARLGDVRVDALDLVLLNDQTDRIFIGTRRGVIQCVHEERHRWPVIHVGGETTRPEKTDGNKDGAPAKAVPEKPEPARPNPPNPPKKPDDNPFGGNPFGS